MSDFLTDGAELFATLCVSDYPAAQQWITALLGAEPAFLATPTEGVWEVAPHRWLVAEARPEHAGHSVVTLFVEDLDARVAAAESRGIRPTNRETYGEGVRKVLFHDPDGNEVGLGGGPTS